ncbi:MAG: hypothetical protein QXG03_11555, partial [Halalkalicoccus sp.]
MIQLSGGIALAGMAGCLGSDDDDDSDGSDDEYQGNETDDEYDGDSDDGTDDDEPKNGDDAPTVDVETHDGRTITVEAKDKPTVVLFADVTSEKGKSYSEELVDLHGKYADHAYMLTINSNVDVSKEDLKEFHETYGGDWDHARG